MNTQDNLTLSVIQVTRGKSNKNPAAIKHYNNFLKGYLEETTCPFDYHAGTIPYLGLGDHGEYQKWWEDHMGKFFYYLTFHAYRYCKKEKGLVSYLAACGYASAMKEYFQRRFRNKEPLIVFTVSWRKLRNTHISLYNNKENRTSQRMVSSDSERKWRDVESR